MTAQGHKKFMFDTDFSPAEALGASVPVQPQDDAVDDYEMADDEIIEEAPPTFSEEDLASAREEGYKAGQRDATNDLTSALEQRLVNTMDTINAQVETLFDAFQRDKEEHSRDSVAVATVIVRKLFPALNMDKAMTEIEHMIVESMKRTSGAPTLIVRVAPELQEAVEAKANEMAVLRGHEGTISVLADDAMSPGDAAVEWDGGGMVRDGDSMWQEIDKIIERNLGSERANGPRHVPEPKTDPAPVEQNAQEVVNGAPVEDNGKSAAESQTEPQMMEGAADAQAADLAEESDQTEDPVETDDETPEEPENGV